MRRDKSTEKCRLIKIFVRTKPVYIISEYVRTGLLVVIHIKTLLTKKDTYGESEDGTMRLPHTVGQPYIFAVGVKYMISSSLWHWYCVLEILCQMSGLNGNQSINQSNNQSVNFT